MKNIDVVIAFLKKERPIYTKNVWINKTGDKLYNYHTCIAQIKKSTLYINSTRYSVTTSKIQSYLNIGGKYFRYIKYLNNLSLGIDSLC